MAEPTTFIPSPTRVHSHRSMGIGRILYPSRMSTHLLHRLFCLHADRAMGCRNTCILIFKAYTYIHASMNDVDNIHTLSMSLLLYVV